MRILVTGSAGFLGSHLVERLEGLGHVVVGLDVRNGQDVRDGIPDEYFDWVLNLACPASPVWYQADPIGTTMTNAIGAMSCLNHAVKWGSRVFQASTSEVYGDPMVPVQAEDYWGNVNPIGVRACYDEGKRFAETLFYDYRRQHGVDIRVGRIFNTYGPGMRADDGRVVSNFIVQALKGEPLTVYGDGLQTRSFCYVDDLIDGIVLLMQSDETRPVNLGNDDVYTMKRLAEIVIELTESKSEIVYKDLPEDDPVKRRPDLSRAMALGYEPKTELWSGLVKTIEYFRGL